jgi:hypothetical protein
MTRWKLPAIIAAMFGTLVLGALLTLFFTSSRMFSGTIYNLLGATTTARSMPDAVAFYATVTSAAFATPQDLADPLLPNTGGGGGGIRQEQAEPIVTPGARVVIRDATLGLIVADPETRIDEIAVLAEEIGGWVVTSNVSGFTNVRGEPATRGSVTVRVPAERLDETLNRIAEGALQVTNRRIQGQDVTQDFVDTESRLRNLEAAEAQLQTLIEQATTVEEIMSVYRELVMTRGEIEVAQGRLNYFTGAAAYSSITVTLEP